MGVQSFQDNELKAAGRMHRRKDVGAAAGWLRDAGFANVSFDLIAGLPHQTEASWDDSVAQLIALRPEHVSVYLMEIDAGSRLGQEVLAGGGRYSAAALPAEDDMASFYEHACRALAGAGYEHYEISNWALPGRRSQHNLKYWKRQPYLGFGAGAHSFKGKQRWANVHDPAAYVAALQQGRDFREPMEMLTPRQQLDEELFLGLRLLEGIDVQRIEREYQVALGERLARLRADGLIEGEGPVVRLSPARLAISNEVFAELMQ
jgi:oxygen-independent coproporphyrinogen-3 oxidase